MIRPVLLSAPLPQKAKETLERLGFSSFALPPCPRLPRALACHADLLFFQDRQNLYTEACYLNENASFFESLPTRAALLFRRRLCPIDFSLGADYPRDVPLNLLAQGAWIYGHKSSFASSLPGFVPVKQGYARCSSVIVGEGVITADAGLARALSDHGTPVLAVRPGHVLLPGYDTGFLGGASFTLSPRLTAFVGDFTRHPDAPAMIAFADALGVRLLSLSGEPLVDVGGALLLSEEPL